MNSYFESVTSYLRNLNDILSQAASCPDESISPEVHVFVCVSVSPKTVYGVILTQWFQPTATALPLFT